MVARRSDNEYNNESNEKDYFNENSEPLKLSPSVIDKDLLKELIENKLNDVRKTLSNQIKINEEDENDDEENEDDENDDNDGENFRDKEKELKEAIKSQLSLESQDAINLDEKAIDAIIEKLKQRGVASEKGLQLQKLRSIKKGDRSIGL